MMPITFVIIILLSISPSYALEWYQTESSHQIIHRLTKKIKQSRDNTLSVCENYACKKKVAITLSVNNLKKLESLFKSTNSVPKKERQSISKAIALLENIAGTQSAIYKDKGENYRDGHSTGFLDCIAESINTFTWLKFLESKRWLKSHTVIRPIYRQGFITSQHWGVNIIEKSTGQSYVVDSWYRDNGFPAVVQSLENWNNESAIADDYLLID